MLESLGEGSVVLFGQSWMPPHTFNKYEITTQVSFISRFS